MGSLPHPFEGQYDWKGKYSSSSNSDSSRKAEAVAAPVVAGTAAHLRRKPEDAVTAAA